MADLIIGDLYAVVSYDGDKEDVYRTDLFFGDVIYLLEKNYPKMMENREYWRNYMNDDIFNHNSFKINFQLWEMSEGYSALSNMYDFLQYDDCVKLSFRVVEELRLEYQFESYQYYNVDNDGNIISLNQKSYIFKNLNTITQVLCAALYYYSLNGLKLQRCKHCEKWFATKNLKQKFCNRISPCFNMVVCGKKVLGGQGASCEKAVDTIVRKFQDRKKQIYDRWHDGKHACLYECLKCPYSDCIEEKRCYILCTTYKEMKRKIHEKPNIDNIIKLHEYLYSNEMPKQERPNRRKSNAQKRLSKKDGANNGNNK